QEEAAYERQQAEIKKEQDFIQRNKARVATRGMANSRQKKLDKMEVLTKRQEKPKPHFHFQSDRTPSRFVIEAKRLVLGYDTALTSPVDIQVERGKKIAIRGTNGLGKSTLLKTLMGIIKPISGHIEHGEFVSTGYFEQESAAGNNNTALEEVWQEYPGMTNFEVRAALASCGLTNDHITTKMLALSGGEAAKVRLCKIMQKPVNLLVLDEPTNHLDVEAKKELKRAIKEYKGTVLLVSHEPEFYEDIVDSVWNIERWTTKII
ncbi:MAG: ABC-F family ATP-binding cassette domain-containing protein, partial [Selenomonas sp.]|nr:ABC-F family ATP-binding cassette domain-containing protein [Selenomonas sp.]